MNWFSLYADADSGECPFAGIHAGGQTQSCGNSRFGCWVCTVVKEDKSLNGFIKSGHRELIPLAEFRKWLMSIVILMNIVKKEDEMVLYMKRRMEIWDMDHLLGKLES